MDMHAYDIYIWGSFKTVSRVGAIVKYHGIRRGNQLMWGKKLLIFGGGGGKNVSRGCFPPLLPNCSCTIWVSLPLPLYMHTHILFLHLCFDEKHMPHMYTHDSNFDLSMLLSCL